MITVEEFIKLLSEEVSWTEGEDFGGNEEQLLRKNCARITHRYLQKVLDEPDEVSDLPTCRVIKDLFDCRICTPHVIQVIAKGIMYPRKRGPIWLFEGNDEVSRDEALIIVDSIKDVSLRHSNK